MGWEALLVAIVLMTLLAPHVSRLRELASLRLPSRVERVPGGLRMQGVVDELFQPLEAELAALGFTFSHGVEMRAVPRSLSPWQPVRVYRHAQHPMVAQLMWAGLPDLPNVVVLTLLAEVREGLVVASSNLPWQVLPPDPAVLRSAGDAFADVRSQYEAQLATMREEGYPDFLPWGDARQIEQRLQAHENRVLVQAVAQGWCLPDGPALMLAPARLLQLTWRMGQQLRRLVSTLRQWDPANPALRGKVPLERVLIIFVAHRAQGRASPAPVVQWTLFLLSCLVFVAAAALVLNWRLAWMLLVVVALHEAGHYLAMRLLGYRRTQMLMLPLVGGVAFGEESRPNGWHRAIVSLAGPVPGVLLAAAVLATAGGPWVAAHAWVMPLAWTMLLVNLLNLLPFHPLDGGHVLETLLPARRVAVRVGLEALAVVGLLGLWWVLDFRLALLLIVLRALSWRSVWRQMRFEHRYREAAERQPPADARAVARLAFQALERTVSRHMPLRQRMRMVDDLLTHLRYRPMRGRQAIAVGLFYAVLLAVPVLLFLGGGGDAGVSRLIR